MVPELIPFFCSQPAGDVSHKPGGRLPLLSASLQLPSQPLRGLLPISMNIGTLGVNSLPKTVTRQRRGCYVNPGPSVPECSKLTTRATPITVIYITISAYSYTLALKI